MPKMKTKSGAKKRFRVRGSGSVKRGQAFKRHILTKKSTKSKRQLRGSDGRPSARTWTRCARCCPTRKGATTMPRVKRGVTARARHKKVIDAGQGLPRPPQERLPDRQGSGDEGGPVPVPRPPHQEARVPRAVDRPHQRGGARARHDVQRVHRTASARRRSTSTARCWPTSPCTTRRRSARSRSRPKPRWPDRGDRRKGRRMTASLFF